MGDMFTDDIILIEDRYTFRFVDCSLTGLGELTANEAFQDACEIFTHPDINLRRPSESD